MTKSKSQKKMRAWAVGFQEEFEDSYVKKFGLEVYFDADKAMLRAGFLNGLMVPITITYKLPKRTV